MSTLENKLYPSKEPMFDRIESEFLPYLETVRDGFHKYIEDSQQKFEDEFYLFETHYLFLMYIADCNLLYETDNGIKTIISKVVNDEFAILSCLKAGCIYQASILLRTLLESLVNIAFIYQDFENRISLFNDHSHFEKYIKSQEDPTIVPDHEKDSLGKKYITIKDKFVRSKSWYYKTVLEIIRRDPRFTRNAQPSLKTLSKLTGYEDYYKSVYSSLSLAVHNSSLLGHMFVAEGRFTISPIYHEPFISNILGLTSSFVCQVFKIVLENNQDEKSKEFSYYLTYLTHSVLVQAERKIKR